MRSGWLARVTMVVVLLAAGQICFAGWQAVSLGTLGGTESCATSVNGAGMVVGYSTNADGQQRAFVWTAERGMVDLGTLGGATSAAYAINDEDEIVGSSDTKDSARHAFLRTAEGTMIDLGTLPGDTTSQAAAIATWVAGSSIDKAGHSRAFVWTIDKGIRALAGDNSGALGINPSDTVVGHSNDRATVWEGTAAPLELHLPTWQMSSARGVNKAGGVVGDAHVAGADRPLAFYWGGNGDPVQLPTPRHGTGAGARAINDIGDAVGSSYVGSTQVPVAWRVGPPDASFARPAVLPLPAGTTSGEAVAVSQSGIIAGVCKTADGKTTAVVWKQVADRPKISVALYGGLYFPTSSKVKDRFDSTWTRVSLGTMETQHPTRVHFTAEGGRYAVSNADESAHIYTVGAGIDKGFTPRNNMQSHVSLRAGPFWGKLSNTLTGASEKKVGLNVNAAYGVVFNKIFSLEARYDYFSKFAGLDFSGFSISAGLKIFDIRL